MNSRKDAENHLENVKTNDQYQFDELSRYKTLIKIKDHWLK
jgi:hypothetical protein